MHHKEQNYFLILFRFLAPVQLKMDDGSFLTPLSEHILGGKNITFNSLFLESVDGHEMEDDMVLPRGGNLTTCFNKVDIIFH